VSYVNENLQINALNLFTVMDTEGENDRKQGHLQLQQFGVASGVATSVFGGIVYD